MTTKEAIQQKHEANRLLHAPFISQVPKAEKDLSTDQPTRALEPAVIASTIEALESGQTHYVDVPGIMPLREAIVAFLGTQGVTGYDPSGIVITASVQEARFLALQILIESSVAIPEVIHPGVKKALGVRPPQLHSLAIDKSKGMLPTLESLQQVVEQGVKVIYLESPVRLTGATYEASEAAKIGQLIESHDATLICDQGLASWVASYDPISSANTTLIGDVFPGVGLEGLPLGFIATSSEQVGEMTKLKQIMSICTSTASQYAALKISETYEEKRRELLNTFQARRQALEQNLSTHVLPGQTATLLALKADASASLQGYSYADGNDFGAPDVIRLLLSESVQTPS